MGAKVAKRRPAGDVPRIDEAYAYVLKQVSATMSAHGGFTWPERGPVAAPDWDPTPRCGGGLHGWLRGEGDGSLADNSPDAKWLILRVAKAGIVDLGGKVKFPSAEVLACGPRHEIVAEMRSLCPDASVIYSTIAKSDHQAASAGYRGQASAGDGGQASAGEKGCVIVQYYDASADRYRVAVGYVGETTDTEGNPLEHGVTYKLDDARRFVRTEAFEPVKAGPQS